MKQIAPTLLVWTILSICKLAAQVPQVSTGRLIRHENFPSALIQARHVDVWLPEGYSGDRRYAVLYMHDGQMLFDSTQSWNRQEWGVDETMQAMINAGKIEPCIVVAIWNGGKMRHTEYFPQKPFETLSGPQKDIIREALATAGRTTDTVFTPKSDRYLAFIVQELKPFIDRTYATKKGRRHTYLMGSSMGGLISLYGVCEYPKVFGGAACLSTHWTGIYRNENNPIPDVLLAYLEKKLPKPGKHRLYLDRGTATLDALYEPTQVKVDALFTAKGFGAKHWRSLVFPGADHSERAWGKRLDQPLVFLLGR